MVKAYFNYLFERPVGQYVSSICNIVSTSTHIYSGVNQYIAIINLRTGEVQKYLFKANKHVPVRCLTIDGNRLFAGYEDGEIIVWDIQKGEVIMQLDMHQSTVSDIKVLGEVMVSAGFDTKIIIWDLISQQCEIINNAHKGAVVKIQIIEIRNEVTMMNELFILSLGKDSYLKLFKLQSHTLVDIMSTITEAQTFVYIKHHKVVYIPTSRDQIIIAKIEQNEDSQTLATRYIHPAGKFNRNTFAKAKCLVVENNMMYLANTDKAMEIYQILNQKEMKARRKVLINRQKEKEKDKQKEENQEHADVTLGKTDEQVRIKYVKTKVLTEKCHDISLTNGQILISTGKNIYNFSTEQFLISNVLGISTGLSLSHPYLAQQSHNQVKIYQAGNFNTLFTLPLEVIHCTLYKSYALILSNKEIIIWNLASNQQIIRKEQPFGKKIYASNNGILVYGDNTLHFYSLGRDKRGNIHLNLSGQKFFSQKIVQCSYLNDVKYIVCTEDKIIQVLYSDSHKVFLSLYGHSLPVRSYDTSTDCNLLVSGSADKDIKLWNLDFGDVKKSIFAHSQAVTVVKFCKDTHYFFSGSQDGHLKYWDGDTGQLILDLEESTQMIRDIVISSASDYVVVGGNDTGFRVWRQTSQQVFQSEERQKRMQKVMVQDYTNNKLKQNQQKTTYEDLKHGQQIIECLEAYDKPATLLKLLQKISPTKLKASLSFLHSKHRMILQKYLQFYVENEHSLQLVWRVCDALSLKDGALSKKLRKCWQRDNQIIRVNTEAINLLLQSIKENKALMNLQ